MDVGDDVALARQRIRRAGPRHVLGGRTFAQWGAALRAFQSAYARKDLVGMELAVAGLPLSEEPCPPRDSEDGSD